MNHLGPGLWGPSLPNFRHAVCRQVSEARELGPLIIPSIPISNGPSLEKILLDILVVCEKCPFDLLLWALRQNNFQPDISQPMAKFVFLIRRFFDLKLRQFLISRLLKLELVGDLLPMACEVGLGYMG